MGNKNSSLCSGCSRCDRELMIPFRLPISAPLSAPHPRTYTAPSNLQHYENGPLNISRKVRSQSLVSHPAAIRNEGPGFSLDHFGRVIVPRISTPKNIWDEVIEREWAHAEEYRLKWPLSERKKRGIEAWIEDCEFAGSEGFDTFGDRSGERRRDGGGDGRLWVVDLRAGIIS